MISYFLDKYGLERETVLDARKFTAALSRRCEVIFEYLCRFTAHGYLTKYEFVTGQITENERMFFVHVNLRAGITFDDEYLTKKRVLVISHIGIYPEHRGGFRLFFEMLVNTQGFSDFVDLIQIECLHNSDFAEKLIKNGWTQSKRAAGDYFFQPIKAEETSDTDLSQTK